MADYSSRWFKSFEHISQHSAEVFAPLLMELVNPKSVVDVGCGLGVWLNEFRKLGVDNVLGVDGDYVSVDDMAIPQECFQPHDLSKPLWLKRKFDLAMTLEVAEHLPQASAADFVDSLTKLAPVVCFSAAIPAQGGKNHVNEQWLEYWADLFAEKNYVVVDALRPKVWNHPGVAYYYAQNAVLFVERSYLSQNEKLRLEHARTTGQLSLVHPELFLNLRKRYEKTWDYRWRQVWNGWKSTLKALFKLPVASSVRSTSTTT